MGLVYLPTWMVDVYAKCRKIYHTWTPWEMGYLYVNLFNFRFILWGICHFKGM